MAFECKVFITITWHSIDFLKRDMFTKQGILKSSLMWKKYVVAKCRIVVTVTSNFISICKNKYVCLTRKYQCTNMAVKCKISGCHLMCDWH